MRKKLLFILIAASLTACHRPPLHVVGITSEAIPVDSSKDDIADLSYQSRLAPIKAEMEREMNVALGYAPERLWIGSPECPMLNWATDALWEEAQRVYPGPVDIAIVNMGGMRCEWLPGPVTRRSVYELMPFDNLLVILRLKGKDVLDLCQSFVTFGGQGVAGLRMKARKGKLLEVRVGGKPVKPNALYSIATSDYLAGGTDHMEALTRYVEYIPTDSLIRDLYIHAVQQQDTVRAVVDGRMAIVQ